ncbi:MAG: OsmC family protein [Candidatus Bathyarchaeia archaeon]
MPKQVANAKLLENVKIEIDNGRGHKVIADLPPAKGGTDLGPTALELALMALAGCGATIYAEICKNSKIDPGTIEVNVEAEKSPESPVISNVIMKVNINSPVRKPLVEAAWRRTEAACPVVYIFKDNMPVTVETNITASQ